MKAGIEQYIMDIKLHDMQVLKDRFHESCEIAPN